MKDLKDLGSMVKFLQSKIDEMEINDTQKVVCRRAIWYAVIKNYGLVSADKKARKAYGIYHRRLNTKKYIKKVFDEHCGADYFEDKKIIRNFEFYRNLENQMK